MRESKLQQECVKYLKSKGIYYINIYGSGRTAKGAPDIIACINGKFVAFELKVEDGVISPSQRIHEKNIRKSGGYHFYPRSLEEFIQILDEMMNFQPISN